MSAQLTLLSEPSVQTMKSFSASGLAKFCSRLTNAPAMEPNIIPTISRLTFPVTRRLTARTSSKTPVAPMHAATGSPTANPLTANPLIPNPLTANPLIPDTIVRKATPRLAPDETPKVYGPARGLRKRVCMISPETDSAAPARTAVIAFGIRMACRILRSMTLSVSNGDSHMLPLHISRQKKSARSTPSPINIPAFLFIV